MKETKEKIESGVFSIFYNNYNFEDENPNLTSLLIKSRCKKKLHLATWEHEKVITCPERKINSFFNYIREKAKEEIITEKIMVKGVRISGICPEITYQKVKEYQPKERLTESALANSTKHL